MNDSLTRPSSSAAGYDDLLALTDRLKGEVIEGTLHTQSRPSICHARAFALIARRPTTCLQLRQGKVMFDANRWGSVR